MKARIGFAFAFSLLASQALAAGYTMTPLVSDQPGVAPVTDPDLINPWGAAQIADTAPIWVSDNGTAKSTFYDRNSGSKSPTVVATHALPTGIVAPPSGSNFLIQGSRATFLFVTILGFIEGWVSTIDPNNALVAVDNSANGKVYTGVAVDGTNKHLLAADFVGNEIEIYDTGFNKIGSFHDTDVPKSYGPFNVAVINGKIYVAYAKKRKPGGDARHAPVVPGAGKGFVDIFDLSGNFQTRLISGSPLSAPWGMAIAPDNFGEFAGKLLVGNFGNGQINAFDKDTGAFAGTVSKKNGKALKISGLWAIDPGPGKDRIQFTAGVGDELHGLIGTIKPN